MLTYTSYKNLKSDLFLSFNTPVEMAELHDTVTLHDKGTISITLRPFLELLKAQKQNMTQTDWLKSVRTLMFRIIEMPDQYLPKELAESAAATATIRSIFHEFILIHTPFQLRKRSS